MKKLGTILTTAALCLGMTMTAFAAGSVTTDVTASAKDKDGNDVAVTVSGIAESAEEYQAVEGAVSELAPEGKEGTVVAVVDVDANGAANVTVEIQVGGDDIKAGDTVMVLHWNGAAWEVVTTTTVQEGNKVTATFESLSPVAIVKLLDAAPVEEEDPTETVPPTEAEKPDDTNQPADTNKPADSNKNDGKSPATGEAGMAGLFVVTAVCGAALVLVNKKKVA